MKLYATHFTDDATGKTHARYVGSQTDASKTRVALKKEGFTAIATADVDVPTDKAGLLGYLNSLTDKG